MSEAVRTPADRFESLPDYPFDPHFHEWEGRRLHFVDEGAGRPVVLFHGEPTWSFLYRKVMRPLLAAGYRVIAPDYFGFGKSDKPTTADAYTYDHHTAAMESLLRALDLEETTAVVQDWGGPIGLRIATAHREWFNRLVILNTFVPDGYAEPNEAWWSFRRWVERTPDVDVGFLMRRSQHRGWGDAVIAGYEAPFLNAGAKEGVRQFPQLVPTSPTSPGVAEFKATRERLEAWTEPALVLFSTEDPIFSTRVGEHIAALIPGAGPLQTVADAGHFLQEDQGEEVGQRIAAFLDANA